MERPQVNQFQLLNSAVLLNINNVQFSFGEESVWLGPGESGSLLMSNNAAPFPAFKIDDVAPHNIPGLSKIFGPFARSSLLGNYLGSNGNSVLVAHMPLIPRIPQRGRPEYFSSTIYPRGKDQLSADSKS